MKLMNFITFFTVSIVLMSCANSVQKIPLEKPVSSEVDELLTFAKANCFFWYFKKKGYDIEDIGAITAGVVERGTYSAEKYQDIAFLVKSYEPLIQTKNNIDIDLLKCFKLEADPKFLSSLESLK